MDYVILGAGPAGLQLGYFLQQAGHDYMILEASDGPGSFFRAFPRHRKLISINKSYSVYSDPETRLRMDWNSLLSDDEELLFAQYSSRYFPPADDLVRYLEDFAAAKRLRIRYGSRVERVVRNGDFELYDDHKRSYRCRRLIVATGLSRPYIPEIPGIELTDNYVDVSVDPEDFKNQRVLIIGKGNSAFETADNLVETAALIHVAGPSSVTLAWRSHFVGHLRAVNNNFLDTYQLKSENAIIDGNIEKITRRGDKFIVTISFVRADEVHKDIEYDSVITCTGFRFDSSLFDDSCLPATTIKGRLPDQTCEWESTNVPDLYFAGTLMQMRDYRQSTSGFIHGFRYCVRSLYNMLETKYHGRAWPAKPLAREPAAVMDEVIGRVNRTSALWQEFAFLCDLIAVSDDGVHYYEELPLDYVHERFARGVASYFVVTLEYGPHHDQFDPFDVTVRRVNQTGTDSAGDSQYLHPVVRHFENGRLLAEHHVTENLENEWDRPFHREALTEFFTRELGEQSMLKAASRG
ncbi:MAG: NAD(P)-binding domain-containing protein [Proteobacteria bacterium]|nr:NAD(P)-binding domain-containing protein [Pseudomonadota bacterium]